MSDSRRGFILNIGFIDHLRIVTTSNYNSLTELHTPNITVTTAHTKFSKSLLVVSWERILTLSAYVFTVWHISNNST
jgi:hypothetical protein